MNYTAIVQQVFSEAEGAALPIEDLLWHIDSVNKSIPTLEELNTALRACQRTSITEGEYQAALNHNHERTLQYLETQGMSRQQIQEILQSYERLASR